MERSILTELLAWRARADRRPLLLSGTRQVGKTWLLQEFGQKAYENVVYCNFETSKGLKNLFARTQDPARILEVLSLVHGEPIRAGRTLLAFDDVQECPEALVALKAFRTEAPAMHVIAAGRLPLAGLDAEDAESGEASALDTRTVLPLTFFEFLAAVDDELAQVYRGLRPGEEIMTLLHERFLDLYHQYLIVGGMPACVLAWADRHDPRRVQEIQQSLLALHAEEIRGLRRRIQADRIRRVYRSLATQLARPSEKFTYGLVRDGARAREYDGAVAWLLAAGLAHRVENVRAPHPPLSAQAMPNYFKLFFCDTGLLHALGDVPNEAILLEQPYPLQHALMEQFLLQQFLGKLPGGLFTYAPDAQHEIPFLLQRHGELLPIDIAPTAAKPSATFRRYCKKYQPKAAVCYSTANYKEDHAVLYLPMYLAGRTDFWER